MGRPGALRPPVIVTFPAQINAVMLNRSAHRSHRQGAVRGSQVRFAIRPGGPLRHIPTPPKR